MNELDRPLVTFAVFAFNQEKYVGDAIAAAFAQSYSPLEIILSDDCSIDNTFGIMQEAVANYLGTHKIVLNRNSKNLNIGGHINIVNQLARGELVIAAAGDDISLPNRVTQLVDAWLATNKEAGLLHSACRVISESGEMLQELACPCLDVLASAEMVAKKNAYVIGATEAWDRRLFNFFGDLCINLTHEDKALSFRSLLAGRPIVYIDQPIVLYRQSVGVSSAYSGLGVHLNSYQRKLMLKRFRIDAQQKLDDLQKKPNKKLERIVIDVANKYDASIQFEEGIPSPMELILLARKVGLSHVMRMTAKRIVNLWKDRE